MARYYNCSDKFLWRQGILPVLFWISIGFSGYLIIMLFHESVVNIGNTALTLSWGAITLFLLIFWIKTTNKKSDSISTWTDGFIGEYLVKRKLLKLNNSLTIFYDVRLPNRKGNIDFVVVCAYGIFSIEVKKKYLAYEHRQQAKSQAASLREYLAGQSIKIEYVEPVLIYALINNINQTDNDSVEILGINDVIIYFEKNMPARSSTKITENNINKIIQLLIEQ